MVAAPVVDAPAPGRKGEHGIAILLSRPGRAHSAGKTRTRTSLDRAWRKADRVTYIWDLSQTDRAARQ